MTFCPTAHSAYASLWARRSDLSPTLVYQHTTGGQLANESGVNRPSAAREAGVDRELEGPGILRHPTRSLQPWLRCDARAVTLTWN